MEAEQGYSTWCEEGVYSMKRVSLWYEIKNLASAGTHEFNLAL